MGLVVLLFVVFLSLGECKHYQKKLFRGSKYLMTQNVVEIENGKIMGYFARTYDEGKLYVAYKGIPYAAPPIGSLRFQPPSPPGNWSGIRDASYERDICVQEQNDSIKGSEDCLYLNIYVPKDKLFPSPKPVMFWIYGGAFQQGDGNYRTYGPDFLLNENVIVVTINYRLGIFGFLSTNDTAAPGNYGLKDIVFALKWVERNMIHFGVRPKDVIIFGQSAGSASVSYLLQTSFTGLFKGAIMQSGTSLDIWSLRKGARADAFDVGSKLGIITENSTELVDQLRTLSFQQVQQASVEVASEKVLDMYLNGFMFGPVIEASDNADAVITQRSYEQLLSGNFIKVPVIIGFNSDELGYLGAILDQISQETFLNNLVPNDMYVDESSNETVSNLIRNHYFGQNGTITCKDFVHYLNDNFLVRGILKFAQLISLSTETYFYEFTYVGKVTRSFRGPCPNGVVHGEEIAYLFRRPELIQFTSERDRLMSKRLVRLWTNFAKYSNPTPRRRLLWDKWILSGKIWQPVYDSYNLSYLDIGLNLEMRADPGGNDFKFWESLYTIYGHRPFDTY